MPVLKIKKRVALGLALGMTAELFMASAHAQSVPDPSTWFSSGPENDKQRQDELNQAGASREYKPRQFGLWLVESTINTGVVSDTNFYSSRYKPKSANGYMVSPTIVGRYTDGTENATVYLDGSVRRYSADGELLTYGGRFGFGNSIELSRGTIWKAFVQLSRSQDDRGSHNATGAGAGDTGLYVNPINSNMAFAATSLLSRLDYAQFTGFVSGGLSANLTRYEDADLSDGSKRSQSSRDTNAYTVTGRVGWNFIPSAYTFIEPAIIWQQTPNISDGDTTTYRLTGGLGTDRVNLMRGEIYAGIAHQMFYDLAQRDHDGIVYGARISWFPTRDITISLNGDDTIGVTVISDNGPTQIYSSRTKALTASLSYQFDQRVTLAARTSFSHITYNYADRKDDIWRAGADVTYMVTGNLGFRLGYTFVNIGSSVDVNSVDRSVYTAGLNVRF